MSDHELDRLLSALAGLPADRDTTAVLAQLVRSACDLTGAAGGALEAIEAEAGERLCIGPVGAGPAIPPQGDGVLRQEVEVRGAAYAVLVLAARPDGTAYDDRDRARLAALAAVAGVVLENSLAVEVSERRRRWLAMFSELTELLRPPITLEDALARIAEAVLRATGATSSLVVQVPDRGSPFAAASAGHPLQLEDRLRDSYEQVVRQAVAADEVRVLDLDEERHALLAPLNAHLTIPGLLVLVHPRLPQSQEREERELLAAFADQAALALDRTQALEDREEMAVITDRDRIARDLHDVVIQRLFATGLHMQSIKNAADTPELKERIDQAVRDLDQTIRDIRGTIFELQTRPQRSLRSELRDLVRDYLPVLGFSPSVQTFGPVDNALEPALHQQFVAVLREALSNIARHAAARTASVEVHVGADTLELRVVDDGRGLPEERTESGLRNARRRAAILGGTMTLSPGEPQGTRLVWTVPLA